MYLSEIGRMSREKWKFCFSDVLRLPIKLLKKKEMSLVSY